jgi:hypothetical protein
MPLDYMLAVMHDEKADKDRRDRMAAAAAPYLHARLQSIDSTVRAEISTSTLTAEQRRQRARQAILDAFAERPLKLINGEVVDAEYKVIAGRDVAADVAAASEQANDGTAEKRKG